MGSVPVFKSLEQGERGAANNFQSVEQVRQIMARHFEQVDLWCSEAGKAAGCCVTGAASGRWHKRRAGEARGGRAVGAVPPGEIEFFKR